MDYIIVFNNTFDVMSAEKILKEKGMEFNMMPTPTSITHSCGLCIRMNETNQIEEIVNSKCIKYKNIYEKNNGIFNEIN